MATIAEALRGAGERLESAGVAEARQEAILLLATLLGLDRGVLLARRDAPLDPEAAGRFERWIARRARREPFQHITGVQEFHGLEFAVDPRVLIPRPETELLVDVVLALALAPGEHVADLATGSGCIAVTLAVKGPGILLHALDDAADALEVARANAGRHGVAARIEFVEADLAEPPQAWRGRMAAVVSNPPYVAEAEWAGLDPEVRDHDPRPALVAGPTGLEAYPSLLASARRLLRPGGTLAVELGRGQGAAVLGLALAAGFADVRLLPDLHGIERVMTARHP